MTRCRILSHAVLFVFEKPLVLRNVRVKHRRFSRGQSNPLAPTISGSEKFEKRYGRFAKGGSPVLFLCLAVWSDAPARLCTVAQPSPKRHEVLPAPISTRAAAKRATWAGNVEGSRRFVMLGLPLALFENRNQLGYRELVLCAPHLGLNLDERREVNDADFDSFVAHHLGVRK
jgi:hypothetical protein